MGLDTVETVLWAEKNFGVEISDEAASYIRTVDEFCTCIHQRLVAKNGFHAKRKSRVFDEPRQYLVKQYGIKPEQVTPEAEFIKDLGMG